MSPSGDFFSQSPPAAILPDEKYIKDVSEGQLEIFTFGQIDYTDIFDRPHWTRFCYRLNPADWVWNIYDAYNDADENDQAEK
jgi:hypothetical protein